MLQWCALFLAVITEVIGTTLIKINIVDQNEPILGYVLWLAMMALSYFFLSKAIVKISLSLSYAVWEGTGLIAITFIGFFLFHEHLPITKIIGISTIVAGILLLKNGSTERNR